MRHWPWAGKSADSKRTAEREPTHYGLATEHNMQEKESSCHTCFQCHTVRANKHQEGLGQDRSDSINVVTALCRTLMKLVAQNGPNSGLSAGGH